MSTTTHPTTDRDAHLAAIIAAPKDDAPRLVFADWLSEHGEEDYGEFIRVQVELALLPDCLTPSAGASLGGKPLPCRECRPRKKRDCLPWCEVCERYDDLRERERELLGRRDWELADRHFVIPGWKLMNISTDASGNPKLRYEPDGVPLPRPSIYGIISRGFVERIELTAAAFLGGPGVAEALFRAHPVADVRLTDREPAEHVRSRTYPHHRPFWFVGPQMGINDRERHWIPPDIGRLIDGDTTPGGPNAVYFDSAEAAHAALSRACVRLGRTRAGVR